MDNILKNALYQYVLSVSDASFTEIAPNIQGTLNKEKIAHV
jgi:hypothetical protein